eukprot:3489906-Rhodomonas_salina.1
MAVYFPEMIKMWLSYDCLWTAHVVWGWAPAHPHRPQPLTSELERQRHLFIHPHCLVLQQQSPVLVKACLALAGARRWATWGDAGRSKLKSSDQIK